jgi:hypothetical protein
VGSTTRAFAGCSLIDVQFSCIKANMGHLEICAAAAGLMSIIFILMDVACSANLELRRLEVT